MTPTGLAQAPLDGATRAGGSTDDEWVRFLDHRLHINDRANYDILLKDIFRRGIYHFESRRPDPLVLDCGSNIGMSILYFKHVYPAARIIAFEPDPTVLPYLKDNIERNGLTNITLIEAALSAQSGEATLNSDGKYASSLAAHTPVDDPADAPDFTVACTRLRDYLTEPVEFLKMNIEGAEWDVLDDCGDRLRDVRSMVIEYHHLPGLPRTLHRILQRLDDLGFDYLINDFDERTNPKSQPPFRLTPSTRYYLLIYATQRD